MADPPLLACRACGAAQRRPAITDADALRCWQCGTILERRRWTSTGAAAALALTTFVLLIPANLLPLYRVELLAGSRASHVTSGVHLFWQQHWPLPAIAMLMFVLILPLLRFAMLALVLGAAKLGHASPRLGPSFRVAQTLAPWAMPEVMLLGIYVAYGRLSALFDLKVGEGAMCMAAATITALLTRALIDEPAVWRALMPAPSAPAGESVSCEACSIVLPIEAAGRNCPRCRARLEARKSNSLTLTTALIASGALLYLPANLLPMAETVQLTQASSYTVFGGVIDLARAGLWWLAALVFTASFAIPLLKLVGMAWLIWSVHTGSKRALKLKTRLHAMIHEIGRWSMVDVLAIGTFVPLMQFDQIANARAMPGMAAFLGVVIATMFSTHSFDPRLLWDAASPNTQTREPLAA